MRHLPMGAFLLLAACASLPDPQEEQIVLRLGSDWTGVTEWYFLPGDRMVRFDTDPGGENPRTRTGTLPPGTYAEARATAERLVPAYPDPPPVDDSPDCPTDISGAFVTFVPPIDGREAVYHPVCIDVDWAVLDNALDALIPPALR